MNRQNQFNGWTNKETWLAAKPDLNGLLVEAIRSSEQYQHQANQLESFMTGQPDCFIETLPDRYQNSLFVELLQTVLYQVDWQAIVIDNS